MASSKWSSFVEQLKHSPDTENEEASLPEEMVEEAPRKKGETKGVKDSSDSGDRSAEPEGNGEEVDDSEKANGKGEGFSEFKAGSKGRESLSEVPTARDKDERKKERSAGDRETGSIRAEITPSRPGGGPPARKSVGDFLASALGGGAKDEVALAIGGDRVYLASRNRPEVVAYETVVALRKDSGEMVAMGREAEAMRGQEPHSIVTEQILEHGMAVDPVKFAGFVRTLLKQHFQSRRYLKPRVLCAGNFPTPLARRATTDAILESGAKEVLLCDPEIAAARGLGIDVSQPELVTILLIEKDWSGASVASMGNSVTRMNAYSGKDSLLEDICIFLQETQGFSPRMKSLEAGLLSEGFVGTLHLEGWEAWGDQLERGRPKSLEVPGAKCREAARHYFLELKHRINRSLEPLDRDRRWTVENSPVHLAGPCAKIPGFGEIVSDVLNRDVECCPESAWALGHGLVELLSEQDFLKRLRSAL